MATRPTLSSRRPARCCLVLGAALVWLHGCVSLPPNAGRAASFTFSDTAATALGRATQPGVAAHSGQSGFHLLPRGLEAFAARAALASRAERSIDAQYYLLHNDLAGRLFLHALLQAADRGVRVRIVTNSLASTDVVAVHAGYARYRRYLLRAGVELYEIDRRLTRAERREKKGLEGSSKASLHAKSFIIDREQVFIGSLNLDPRSIVENTEIGILLESAPIAARMADWFEQISRQTAFRLALVTNRYGEERLRWYRDKDGVTQVFTTEPNAGFWLRFGADLLRLLPIESQL